MKILIIDNGTKYLDALIKELSNIEFSIFPYKKIDAQSVAKYDAIILTGGHNFPVLGNENKLKKEIEIIKNFPKPILGICLGFELIARIFGSEIKQMTKREKGIIDIEVIEKNVIFKGIKKFKVYENHRWAVEKLGNKLTSLAKSADGVEAIKHQEKPIYGVQFHPEMFIDKTCGNILFNNFINLITKE